MHFTCMKLFYKISSATYTVLAIRFSSSRPSMLSIHAPNKIAGSSPPAERPPRLCSHPGHNAGHCSSRQSRLDDLVDGLADIWRLGSRNKLHSNVTPHVNAEGDAGQRHDIAHKSACHGANIIISKFDLSLRTCQLQCFKPPPPPPSPGGPGHDVLECELHHNTTQIDGRGCVCSKHESHLTAARCASAHSAALRLCRRRLPCPGWRSQPPQHPAQPANKLHVQHEQNCAVKGLFIRGPPGTQ